MDEIRSKEEYLKEIRTRVKKNRVSQKFQLTGLALADILEDREHKALYIKLAKERDEDSLISLAKRVAENGRIKNRGAYFMKLVREIKKNG